MKWYINVPNVWKPPTRRSLESGQWSPSPNLHPPCSPSSGWILCMELATPSGQYPIVVQSFVHQFPLPSCNTNIEIYFILPYKQSISTKIGKTTIYLEPHMSHILMARQCLLNDYIYIYILIYIYIIDIYIYIWIYICRYIIMYLVYIPFTIQNRCNNWPIPACSSDRVNSRPRRREDVEKENSRGKLRKFVV